jgi:hypothetical protein
MATTSSVPPDETALVLHAHATKLGIVRRNCGVRDALMVLPGAGRGLLGMAMIDGS